MSFEKVTYTENKNCRFVLTSTAGVVWGDVFLHRAVVSVHRPDEEWARAAIELQGSMEGWVVYQVSTYSEKDRSWWPFLLHIFAVDVCPLADVLAQRLCDVFHHQRMVEEEAAWIAQLELQRPKHPVLPSDLWRSCDLCPGLQHEGQSGSCWPRDAVPGPHKALCK